jgi:hypothetical protein
VPTPNDNPPAEVPGWFASPTKQDTYQWWDGHEWTEHFAIVDPERIPTLSGKFKWTKLGCLMVAFTCIMTLFVGILLFVSAFPGSKNPSLVPQIIFCIAGSICLLMVLLLPVSLSRRSYKVQPGSVVSCTGLLTHHARSGDVKQIRFKARPFGMGGVMWTGYVDLKNRRGFWLRGIEAGSPRRHPEPPPVRQGQLDRMAALLDSAPDGSP